MDLPAILLSDLRLDDRKLHLRLNVLGLVRLGGIRLNTDCTRLHKRSIQVLISR